MASRTTAWLTAIGPAAAIACGSAGSAKEQPDSGPAPAATTASDDGGGIAWTPGGDSNPDGFAYPSPANGYGRNIRSGTTPGSVMANFKFLGYVNAMVSPRPTKISLADYYDPCGKRYKLIHVTVASVWCGPCQQETIATVAAQTELLAQGVVVLQALDDGPVQQTGATQGDLDRWISKYHTNFTELLDPGLQNFAGFFKAAEVPWNADLDPRTMEIVDASPGWAGDIMTELAPAFSALPAAPSYPSTVTCN
ncbi:MAG: redoxin domain-containing protein [Myxococcota bacterium]|nr:redoxin domain-containing protein [Myxococcota bacterium]